MIPSQAGELLRQASPPLLGVIATVRGGGAPHAVPVWYHWDGQAVSIWTGADRAWVRHLRRDCRAAFTAHQAGPPYGAVILHGRAVIDDDADPGDIRRIARRYLPAEQCDDYIASWPQLRAIVRVRPAGIRAWNRGY